MSTAHFKEVCEVHGTMLKQCRCPGPKEARKVPCPAGPGETCGAALTLTDDHPTEIPDVLRRVDLLTVLDALELSPPGRRVERAEARVSAALVSASITRLLPQYEGTSAQIEALRDERYVLVPLLPTQADRPGEQPRPIANDSEDVQSQLQRYIEERKQLGIARYGTALQAGNGRDALRDAFEEVTDSALYLAQALIERDGALPPVDLSTA